MPSVSVRITPHLHTYHPFFWKKREKKFCPKKSEKKFGKRVDRRSISSYIKPHNVLHGSFMGKIIGKLFMTAMAVFGLFGAVVIVYTLGTMIMETDISRGGASENYECGRMGCN